MRLRIDSIREEGKGVACLQNKEVAIIVLSGIILTHLLQWFYDLFRDRIVDSQFQKDTNPDCPGGDMDFPRYNQEYTRENQRRFLLQLSLSKFTGRDQLEDGRQIRSETISTKSYVHSDGTFYDSMRDTTSGSHCGKSTVYHGKSIVSSDGRDSDRKSNDTLLFASYPVISTAEDSPVESIAPHDGGHRQHDIFVEKLGKYSSTGNDGFGKHSPSDNTASRKHPPTESFFGNMTSCSEDLQMARADKSTEAQSAEEVRPLIFLSDEERKEGLRKIGALEKAKDMQDTGGVEETGDVESSKEDWEGSSVTVQFQKVSCTEEQSDTPRRGANPAQPNEDQSPAESQVHSRKLHSPQNRIGIVRSSMTNGCTSVSNGSSSVMTAHSMVTTRFIGSSAGKFSECDASAKKSADKFDSSACKRMSIMSSSICENEATGGATRQENAARNLVPSAEDGNGIPMKHEQQSSTVHSSNASIKTSQTRGRNHQKSIVPNAQKPSENVAFVKDTNPDVLSKGNVVTCGNAVNAGTHTNSFGSYGTHTNSFGSYGSLPTGNSTKSSWGGSFERILKSPKLPDITRYIAAIGRRDM